MMRLLKKTTSLLLLASFLVTSVQASSFTDEKTGFTVRPSALKETEDREDVDVERTLGEAYGVHFTELNNGNYTSGKQDQFKEEEENTTSLATSEPKNVINNTVEGRAPVANNKACKGTQKDIDDLIAFAKSKLASDKTGNYWWGGENPDVPYKKGRTNPNGVIDRTKGVDCSGFVKVCYEHIGVSFAGGLRTTRTFLSSLGVSVSYEEARPGDVLLFAGGSDPKGSVCHTGIYLGDDKAIHSSGDQYNCYAGVTISDIVDNPKGGKKMGGQAVIGIKRVIALSNQTATKGSVSKPNITHLSKYGDGVGVMYSVGGKYTIGINAGHQQTASGDVKSGTTSLHSKVPEYKLTLQVAEKLRDALLKEGYNVLMTRTKHDVNISNVERGKMFSDQRCDMSIGIHFNGAVQGVTGHGFQGVMDSSHKNEAWAKKAMGFCAKLKTKLASKQNKIPAIADTYATYKGFNSCNVPYFYFELGYINAASGVSNTDCPYVESKEYWNHFINAFIETTKQEFK